MISYDLYKGSGENVIQRILSDHLSNRQECVEKKVERCSAQGCKTKLTISVGAIYYMVKLLLTPILYGGLYYRTDWSVIGVEKKYVSPTGHAKITTACRRLGQADHPRTTNSCNNWHL